jgi:hypothetical protein
MRPEFSRTIFLCLAKKASFPPWRRSFAGVPATASSAAMRAAVAGSTFS